MRNRPPVMSAINPPAGRHVMGEHLYLRRVQRLTDYGCKTALKKLVNKETVKKLIGPLVAPSIAC